jgi:hypothetical protein
LPGSVSSQNRRPSAEVRSDSRSTRRASGRLFEPPIRVVKIVLHDDRPVLRAEDGVAVRRHGFVAPAGWAKTKHKLLTDYIQASGGARSHYNKRSGAAYIDVFCGPGRLLISDSKDYIDGNPVAAYRKGLASLFIN